MFDLNLKSWILNCEEDMMRGFKTNNGLEIKL